ncbi:MAG: DUF4388 domain-containing protein [Nitrospinae bacterium]|nr:DUF4388 domain-containing protein [Nitrospinota bacterium]
MQGNLKDFSITNILPIIKAETKTGLLEVKGENRAILVSFQGGNVVYAQYGDNGWFTRLRDMLGTARLVTPEAWKSLEQYADTPEHFWSSLANVIPPESASAALRRQVTDTLFDLLRYKRGTYVFTAMKSVEYPDKLINPMDVDFLLMEGCRIADEFGMIEKQLPKPDKFLRRSILSEEEMRAKRAAKNENEPPDFRDTMEFAILSARGVEINDHEVKILSVMTRPRQLKQILNMADLSSYDASNAVLSALNKKVVVEMTSNEVLAFEKPQAQSATGGYIAIAFALLLLAFGIFHRATYWHPLQMANWRALGGAIAGARAGSELAALHKAIKIYHLRTGQMPSSMLELIRSGIISDDSLKDPWKHDYVYQLGGDQFSLSSLGPDGAPSADDIIFSE